MKLFKVSQDVNGGYDTFDSMIVAEESEDAAKYRRPEETWELNEKYDSKHWWEEYHSGCWTDHPDQVTVQYLGEAGPEIKAGIILASFNAG